MLKTILFLALVGSAASLKCYTYTVGGSDATPTKACDTSTTSSGLGATDCLLEQECTGAFEATECYRQNAEALGIKAVAAGCKIASAACTTASVSAFGISSTTSCGSCATDLCNSGAATSPAVALVLAVFAAIYKLM